MALVRPSVPVRPPPLVSQLRAAETRQRHGWWLLAVLAPLVLLLGWPILFVACLQVACWYAGWTARPARWVVGLHWLLLTLLTLTFEWWRWFPAYATDLLVWTVATVLHAKDGLPLWDTAYLTELWWLASRIAGTATLAGLWLASCPGFVRLCFVALRPFRKTGATIDVPRLAFTTAGELAHRPQPVIRGLWGAHFPKDGLTMLHAREKVGKSTFLTALFAAFGDGSPFFGLETMSCTILYATEEAAETFRDKAERLPSHVAVVTADQVSGLLTWENWPAVLEVLLQRAKRVGARLLVVDTLGHWMPGAELGTVRAQQTVYVLKQAVARGVGILLVHHDAKRGGARGPVALMAGVDRVIHLETVEGDPTMRRLAFSGRFASRPPDDLVYRMDEAGNLTLLEGGIETGEGIPGEHTSSGPARDGKADPWCTAILAYLAGTPAGGAERTAISAGVGLAHKATYVHLDHLAEAGKIEVRGAGRRGDPRVYWLPDRVPDEVPIEELTVCPMRYPSRD